MPRLVWMVRFAGFVIGALFAAVITFSLAGCGEAVNREFRSGGGTQAEISISANSGGTYSTSGWEVEGGKLKYKVRHYPARRR